MDKRHGSATSLCQEYCNEGLDAGGVFRSTTLEYVRNLILLKNDGNIPLFSGIDGFHLYPSSSSITLLRTEETYQKYRAVGKFMFLSLIYNVSFPFTLHKFVIKYILGEEIKYSGFSGDEVSWYRSLTDLGLTPKSSGIFSGEYGMCPLETFARDVLWLDDTVLCSEINPKFRILAQNGNQKLAFWKDFFVNEYFIEKNKKPLDEMKEGFHFAKEVFEELEPNFDLIQSHHMKLCQKFSELVDCFYFRSTDKFEQDIRSVFLDLDLNNDELAMFTATELYEYIVGYVFMPPPSLLSLSVKTDNSDRLPVSHTCALFVEISRPRYSTNGVFNKELFISDINTLISYWKNDRAHFGMA